MAVHGVRITAGVLLGLLLLAGLAVAAIGIGGAPALRWAIEHPLSRLAGHQINIDGTLSVHWGAPTRITADRIRVANAPWGSRLNMLVAQHVEIELFPASFVLGRRHLPLIAVDHALLLLERARSGETNWASVLTFVATVATGGKGGAPIIDHLALRDSRLQFHDMASGAETDMTANAVELQSLAASETARLTADGRFQQLPIRLEGTARSLAGGAPGAPGYAIELDGTLAESNIAAHGTLDGLLAPKRAELDLHAGGRNLQQIAAAFGVPLPSLPDFFRTEGRLSGGGGNWTIAIASLKLGHSDLAGELAIDTRRKAPYFRATLTSSLIDSADFIGFLGLIPPASSAPRNPKDGPPMVVPATPAAVKELLGFDADLSLSVDAKRFAATLGPPLDGLSATLQLRGGVLTVQKLQFGLAGGTAAISLTLDARPEAPTLGLDLDARKVDLRRLVREARLPPAFQETAGTGASYVHLRSSGHSLREFLGHMDGEAGVFVADGQFDPVLKRFAAPDVLQAVGLEVDRGKPVPVACLVAQFDLRDGVATARTLMLDTEPSVLVGTGNFNFAAETIYLDLTPHHKHFDPLNLGAPIELRGTFADAKISVSKANILQRLGNWLESDRVAPPPALLPLIDAGLGPGNSCDRVFKTKTPEQPLSGSSRVPSPKR
jgi:AsmA family protein